jgi:general secretion pathway protein E
MTTASATLDHADAPSAPVQFKSHALEKHFAGRNSPAEPAPDSIEDTDELPDFKRILYEELDMAPSLRHRLCPVELVQSEGHPRFAIILLADEQNTDITGSLAEQLKAKGFIAGTPLHYVASKTVLADLARDKIVSHKKRQAKTTGPKRADSALGTIFESAAGFAIDSDASDLHFEINHQAERSPIRFRVDGRLTSPKQFELPSMNLLDTIAYMYNTQGKSGSENSYNENKPQQCHIKTTIKGRRLLFRWASHPTANGTKVVLRMLFQDSTQSIRSLKELGYLDHQILIWQRAIARLGGAILISGVVGSGKSTTMQTIMSMFPQWMAKYTVEDPVEYIMPNTSQFPVSRTLSERDDDTFLGAKRQLKRMDPDAVLIGEIRDRESAGLFRDIGESGHRALATVHAPSAIDMLTLRLVSEELGLPRDVLATPDFLNLLVYQALVPKLCTRCSVPASQVHGRAYLQQIERLFGIDASSVRACNQNGCQHCKREHIPELNGSKGRIVVAEMIEPDETMLMLFRQRMNVELKRYIASLRTSAFTEPDSTGKNALEVAMYHVSQGSIDPREVELKFGTFDSYERARSPGQHGAPEAWLASQRQFNAVYPTDRRQIAREKFAGFRSRGRRAADTVAGVRHGANDVVGTPLE